MVHELLDKSIIYVCCLLFAGVVGLDGYFISAALFAIIIAMLGYVDRLPGYFTEIMVIVYMVLVVLVPAYVAFIPVLAYDMYRTKMKYATPVAVIVYISIVYCAAKAEWLVDESMARGILITTICAGVLSAVSILLEHRTSAWIKTDEMMRKIRDEGIENSMVLQMRNNELIEKQNNEINLATLKERNRIAREIHDNVGHMLTRAILQTGALKVIVKDEAVKEQIGDLGNTLNTAMDNIRSSVHDLHDESIDLKKAVEEIMVSFPTLDISLHYDVTGNIENNMKYSFIAIIKEALNNTAKHSNGNKVKINIAEHPGFFQLVISDNGTGISGNFSGGMGLSGIAERVKQLHGNFNISTEKGFRISISVMK